MKGSAWVVSVDMGYGHQRAAYPLKDIAYERIITANSDKIISYDERKLWERTRFFYEFISRLKKTGYIGKAVFALYDKTQSISPFFPFRDLSKPNYTVLMLKRSIERGLCKNLIEYVKKKDLPLVATHPFPAVAAHYHGLNKIFCVVTDTDISRGWVIDEPRKNTITYFAPCIHVAVRLREYGISEDKIIVTGFPLPKENIGKSCSILKKDLSHRLFNLDPNKVFLKTYEEIVKKNLGTLPLKKDHPLTITYAVGGAGAEIDVGLNIVRSIKERILSKEIAVNLVAGTRLDVYSLYKKETDGLGLDVNIVFALDKRNYFMKMNEILRKTDILWTKPSEMSFFTALGLPIIIAPPIGAHEKYNREWLSHMGSGFVQEDPNFTNDWLFYWLADGRLAKAAWQGYTEAPFFGTYKIEKIIMAAYRNYQHPKCFKSLVNSDQQ